MYPFLFRLFTLCCPIICVIIVLGANVLMPKNVFFNKHVISHFQRFFLLYSAPLLYICMDLNGTHSVLMGEKMAPDTKWFSVGTIFSSTFHVKTIRMFCECMCRAQLRLTPQDASFHILCIL